MSFKMQFYGILHISMFVVMFRSVNPDILPSFKKEVIINGRDAAEGQFPYECALHFRNQFICTSSIISNEDVLTAAHCVVLDGTQQSASQFHAICNVNKSKSEYRVDFSDVTVHPNYDPNAVDNDLAIFEASQPIPFSTTVNRVCLARPDTGMDEYSKATAMGWGKTNRDPVTNEIPEILQYVEQNIVRNGICSIIVPGVNENKICAGGFFNGICSGDSGGSLVHLNGQNDVQIGITSYILAITGCGSLVPAVFTRVSTYTEFIISVAKGDICTK